jgi:hypothetical protein
MAAQSTTPGKVFLIRHGEKLGDAGSDKDGGPNLSLQGSARAAAIPTLFAPASSEFDCTIKADTSSFKASYGTQALTGAAPPVRYAGLHLRDRGFIPFKPSTRNRDTGRHGARCSLRRYDLFGQVP